MKVFFFLVLFVWLVCNGMYVFYLKMVQAEMHTHPQSLDSNLYAITFYGAFSHVIIMQCIRHVSTTSNCLYTLNWVDTSVVIFELTRCGRGQF